MDQIPGSLSRGAIRRIFNHEEVDKPVLHLRDLQQGSSEDPNSMFLLDLSDGETSHDNCMVQTPQLIKRLYEGEFEKSSVVVLNDYYLCKKTQTFIYVKDMSLLKIIPQTQCLSDTQTDTQSDMEIERGEQEKAGPSNNTIIAEQQKIETKVESQSLPQTSESSNWSPLPSPIQTATLSPMPSPIRAPNQSPVQSPIRAPNPTRILSQNRTRIQSPNVVNERTTSGPSDVLPINRITTNESNCFTIRGRVTSKGKKRKWNNHNGEGSVFSFVVSDQSGDIRLNSFNRLCDKFYNLIEENKVYRISGGAVKMADKRFSNLSNDYEILLTCDTKVVECPPEEAFVVSVCKPNYKFVSIKDLLEVKRIGEVVDVIGAVVDVGQLYWIPTKQNNRKDAKRDITLMDGTDKDISLTLWKENAEHFECQQNDIIAVQSAVIKDFGGKTLTAYPNTNIKIKPDIPEANPIKEWLSRRQTNRTNESISEVREKGDHSITAPSPWNHNISRPANEANGTASRIRLALLDQITEQSIGAQKQSVYYVRARVAFPVNRSPLYKSCYKSRCFKKLMELPNGFYRCTKCVEETDRFQWRLFLAAVLTDITDERWIHLFDAEAARLLGCTAQQLSQYTDQELYDKILHLIEYKSFLWKIGAKMQSYLSGTEVKLNVLDFWPTDPIKDSKELIKSIKKLSQN